MNFNLTNAKKITKKKYNITNKLKHIKMNCKLIFNKITQHQTHSIEVSLFIYVYIVY
jgi:hypothetical protein